MIPHVVKEEDDDDALGNAVGNGESDPINILDPEPVPESVLIEKVLKANE